MPAVTRSASRKVFVAEEREQAIKPDGDKDGGDEEDNKIVEGEGGGEDKIDVGSGNGAKGDKGEETGEERPVQETSVLSIMERMTQGSIPNEVLERIIGFVLRSATGFCAIPDDGPGIPDTWEAQAMQASGLVFPEGFSETAKQRIRHIVAATFPKSVVLGIPVRFAEFRQSSTTARPSFVAPLVIYRRDYDRRKSYAKVRLSFVVPPMLQGIEHRLRNLVLNVPVSKERIGFERELKMAKAGMENLAHIFPRLETCLFVVNVDAGKPGQFFPSYLLQRDTNPFSWKEELIDFIKAFAEYGPGRRRLFRFDHCRVVRQVLQVGVGPTVRVDGGRKRMNDGNGVEGGSQNDELDEVENLLHQAYRLKRQVGYK